MQAKRKGSLWYRWSVNYRDARGRIRQEIVDSIAHQDAIVAARVMHPTGRDFTAVKLSTRPI